MPRHASRTIPFLTVFVALVFSIASPAAAQQNAPDPQDNDRILQPAEPDFRIINLPTTMRLPLHGGNFDLTHRFDANLRRGSFGHNAGHLFGIDEGAVVGFEYRFGIARHVQASIYRHAFKQTIQMYSKVDAVHQNAARPLSLSAVVSVEGADNFQSAYAPALGGVVSRMVGDTAAFYVVPIWVHNTAASIGIDRNTFFVGVGGRVRIWRTVYIAAEISPRVSGYGQGKPEYGFAIERRAGGHMFQINFTNSQASTLAQIARGGTPATLYLGFNLSRKFF